MNTDEFMVEFMENLLRIQSQSYVMRECLFNWHNRIVAYNDERYLAKDGIIEGLEFLLREVKIMEKEIDTINAFIQLGTGENEYAN